MPEPLREIDKNPMHYFELGYIPLDDYIADLKAKEKRENARVLSTQTPQSVL